MSITWGEVCAVATCWGLAVVGTGAGDAKPPSTDDPAITAFVAFLQKNGVKLEPDGKTRWVVTTPKGEGYHVIVSLTAFPAGTGEEEMRAALKPKSLAHTLNVRARLAMSVPGLRGTDPARRLPKLDEVPAARTLQTLFEKYSPLELKK